MEDDASKDERTKVSTTSSKDCCVMREVRFEAANEGANPAGLVQLVDRLLGASL